MGYVTGKILDRRVKEAGLQELSDLLYRVASGKESWPGLQVIEVFPEGKEYVRNLLYSLLHSIGVKELYKVSSPQGNILTLGIREGKGQVVVGVYGEGHKGGHELTEEEQGRREDLDKLFEDAQPGEMEKPVSITQEPERGVD